MWKEAMLAWFEILLLQLTEESEDGYEAITGIRPGLQAVTIEMRGGNAAY
jgi:hypothetical protein